MSKPGLLITIDTEEDNAWGPPRADPTRNAAVLPRFQALCEAHGLRPTYLTDYPMAASPVFRDFGSDVLRRRAGEIGMHLHAWNTPPRIPLTADDGLYHPYLIEYPEVLMREKIARMTDVLECAFGVKMVSHRAGRWSLNAAYVRLLIDFGYRVDCSVTPHVSWRRAPGDPLQHGGTDFSRFPEEPYFVDPADISRAGASPLLELPVTIAAARHAQPALRLLNRFFPPVHWLRPNGRNQQALLALVDRQLARGAHHLEFILHSSELMPGGSPTFADEDAIECLYDDLEALFAYASQRCRPLTLAEFHQDYVQRADANRLMA